MAGYDYYLNLAGVKPSSQVSEVSRVNTEIGNLHGRLSAIGEDTNVGGIHPLAKILDLLSRPNHAVMNTVQEYTDTRAGSTPMLRDPLQAFLRGLKGEERTTGKDIAKDFGASTKPWFTTHVGPVKIAPNPAGLMGLGLDILNPIDPLNWVAPGIGKVGVKGASAGLKLMEKSFGKEVAEELATKLSLDRNLTWANNVQAPSVGQLVDQITKRADKLGIQKGVNTQSIIEMMQKGMTETGVKAGTSLDIPTERAIQLGIQAPFTNKRLATLNVPGSTPVLDMMGKLGGKVGRSPVGQAWQEAFNTNFVPDKVPNMVWTRAMRQGAEKPESPWLEPLKGVPQAPKTPTEMMDELYPTGAKEGVIPPEDQILHTSSFLKSDEGSKQFIETYGRDAYNEVMEGLKKVDAGSSLRTTRWVDDVETLFKGTSLEERKLVQQAVINPNLPIPEHLVPMRDAFREEMQREAEMYRKMGVNFVPIEAYVPFIPVGKPLTKDEASLLKGIFGPQMREFNANSPEDFLKQFVSYGYDPSLLKRTINALDPAEVNKVLGREWLSEDAAVSLARRGIRAIRGEEATTFFKGFVDKYDVSDLVKATGQLPEGYVGVKVIPQHSGRLELQAVMDTEKVNFILPEEFVRAYNTYTDMVFNPEAKTQFGRFFDQATRAYKTMAYMWNPGHIPRDATSNIYNLWLADVRDPTVYGQAAKVMYEAGQVRKGKKYVGLKAEDVDSDLGGLIDSLKATSAERAEAFNPSYMQFPEWEGTSDKLVQMAEDLHLLDSGTVTADFLKSHSDWSTRLGGKYTDVMRKGTRANDNFARLAGLIDGLKKGMTPEAAAARVKKYLFDYNDLTPFERRWMKRVIPFYTWMRKNIPLQIETLLTKPGKYSTTAKFLEDIGGIAQEGDAPGFIVDQAGVNLQGDEGPGSGMYVLPSLPYQDLSKIPVSFQDLQGLLAMTNPIPRAVVEMITNTALFSGQPLEQYAGEREKIPLGNLLEQLGVVENAPTVRSRVGGYLLGQIPPIRNISTVGDPTNPRQEARLLSILGGPQIYPGDWAGQASTYEQRNKLRALVRALQDTGTKVPTTRELEKSAKGNGFDYYLKLAGQ